MKNNCQNGKKWTMIHTVLLVLFQIHPHQYYIKAFPITPRIHICSPYTFQAYNSCKFTSCTKKSSNMNNDDEFYNIHEENDDDLDIETLQTLTVPQLKQQLRLRRSKVTGRKKELIDRLIHFESSLSPAAENNRNPNPNPTFSAKSSKAHEIAQKNGKNFIDVTAYIENENDTKTSQNKEDSTEVWGEEAKKVRITSDLNDDNPVIDNLSRTIIEYSGYKKEKMSAFVVASRDALKGYLAGGSRATPSSVNKNDVISNSEQKVRQIQIQREKASRVPMSPKQQNELEEGIVEEDEKHTVYDNIVDRDYTDWGVYTHTGAQISASEVKGILYLSDVCGPFNQDAKALCEKMAHECQPCVVMAPDLFRGKPWEEDPNNKGFNTIGQDYEEWREQHLDVRVNVDIRASAAILRERYAVSSIAIFGTCYGGGRALETAAGYIPISNQKKREILDPDLDPVTGPSLVHPAACIAWYPTRYNAEQLFGANGFLKMNGSSVAVMGIFAENDVIPGARPEDASILKKLLDSNDQIRDNMIKVFHGQEHGFAHIGLGERKEFGGDNLLGGNDGEVAALLSTAFLETYTRMFLPTVGKPIKNDDEEGEWTSIEMKDNIGSIRRDVRAEIEAAEKAYEDTMDSIDFDYEDVGTKFW